MDRAEVGQVIIKGIAGAQHRLTVFEKIPCKTNSRAEIVLVHTIERLFCKSDEPSGIRLGAIW